MSIIIKQRKTERELVGKKKKKNTEPNILLNRNICVWREIFLSVVTFNDNSVCCIFLTFLGFDNASLSVSVQEGESSNNRVTLRVIRRFGLRGGSSVHWEARLNGVLATDDITPVQGDLVFAQGISSRDIEFDIKPDAIPEVLEVRDLN